MVGAECGSLALGAGVWDPGAIAALLVGTFDGDAVSIEPQRDRAAPPGIDPVDHWHHRAAAEPGRHLADDSVEAAAFERQCCFAGDDRDMAIMRRV